MAFTGFVNEFTSTPIQPSYSSYLEIDFSVTNSPIQLEWIFQNQNTSYPFSQYIQVTTNTSNSNSIILPNAEVASVVQATVLINSSSNDVIIETYNGTILFTISPGNQYIIEMVSNATTAGTWLVTLLGSGTSEVIASSLVDPTFDDNEHSNAGGIISSGNYLKWNQLVNTYTSGSSYDQLEGDRGALLVWTAGTGTYNCRSSAVNGDGFVFAVLNNSTSGAIIEIVPATGDTINGESTSFYIYAGESSAFVCDGTSTIYSYCETNQNTTVSNLVNIDLSLATSSSITITSIEASYTIQKFINNYTSSPLTVYYPQTTVGVYIAFNDSSTTTIIVTILGSDFTYSIPPGESFYLFSDGVNLYKLPSFYEGIFYFSDGTSVAPSLTFFSDATAGAFLDTTTYNSNSIIFVQDETQLLALNKTQIIPFVQTFAPNGLETEPSYSFFNANQTGLYVDVTGTNEGDIVFSVNGSPNAYIGSDTVSVNLPLSLIEGAEDEPALYFNENTSTGLYYDVPGIGITINGTTNANFTGSEIVFYNTVYVTNGSLKQDSISIYSIMSAYE